jgi:hypothetical protein
MGRLQLPRIGRRLPPGLLGLRVCRGSATWNDRRSVRCQFDRGAGPCGNAFELLSNAHLVEELDRLRDHNGVLDGPRCGACGARYLEKTDEFVLNGTHGKRTTKIDGEADRPVRLRVIHKPCRGKPGARFSVTLDHFRQKATAQNLQILQALVNGTGVIKICRMLTPAGAERTLGVSRVYDRIFWLERTLLAFEREQLRRWRESLIRNNRHKYHHLSHDDIVLTVNWETSEDRRLTQLNCSATADVRSGYVFRIDVDFDPRVDPAGLVESVYGPPSGPHTNLRQTYTRKTAGPFTAPLLSIQRATGRFDEEHLFAAALNQYRVFKLEALRFMDDSTPTGRAQKQRIEADVDARMAFVSALHHGYFNLPESTRDRRTPFTGVMTRFIYTKAAHFLALREMLPPGSVRLITEMESTLPRLLPHIFADLVETDDFTWLAMSFDKEVKTTVAEAKVAAFKKDYGQFTWEVVDRNPAAETWTNSQFLRAYIAEKMTTRTKLVDHSRRVPFQNDNYRQKHQPQLWVQSPMQTSGEIDRVVGFPLVRRTLRHALKPVPWNADVQTLDEATRNRMARLVFSATLQPVSTFFNSIRERISPTKRSGGRATRVGPSYINGAVYNPRVLVALLNIYRVYYNWFDNRPYVSGLSPETSTTIPKPGISKRRVPGTGEIIKVKRKRKKVPVRRTPAMRLGIQEVKEGEKPKPPSLYRMLYRPWLYAGTPVWDKFENPTVDMRSRRYRSGKRVQ